MKLALNTCYFWNSFQYHRTIILFIGRCGANVNMRGPEGETALHLAAAGGHHDVVKFLLNEGADVDLQDDVS